MGNAMSSDNQPQGTPQRATEVRAQQVASTTLQLFIVKRHDARRHHYDFRLGHNRVLKSWVLPDGPSYRFGDQREAIQVDDHSRETPFFEGVIPAGRYGAGTVMLWDWGTWEPLPDYTDVDASLRNGFLKFSLYGEKLKATWRLTRTRRSTGGKRNSFWMLVKEQDAFARSKTANSILKEAPNSISSGKTLEEIAGGRSPGKNELQGMLFDEDE